MEQKTIIKPTKLSLVIGLIVSIVFLIFGVFFFSILSSEPEEYIGQGFLILWILVVLLLGGFFAYSLISCDKNDSLIAGNEIDYTDEINKEKVSLSFDEKLRKLENLKKVGLIDEEEYVSKRSEIMKKKNNF